MKRTILSILLVLAVISTFVLISSNSSEAAVLNSDAGWSVHVYGPAGHTGCYTGPASGNFTLTGGHIYISNLPAGVYTFCINGGCTAKISVPTENAVNCGSGDPSLYCNCTNP